MSRSDELLSDLTRSWPRDLGEAARLRTSSDEADRLAYARDLWPRHHMDVRGGRPLGHRPGLIVWPRSTREVQAVVRWAAARSVPLVPFGAGSGVCGGVLPESEAVVMDLKRMTAWRRLDRDAPSLDVEAGALGLPLEEELGRAGFTLGHFPSSILCSTVGGWVAARSAGQCSGYYGKIEDMVVSLEHVTGSGDVVTLPRRAHGPDLTPLVVGSEGILGVVTAATLRLHPAPAERSFGSFTFPTTEAGWEGMRAVFQAGLRPAVSRLYDPFDAMLARMGGVKGRKKGADAKDKRRPEKKGLVPGLGSAALRVALRNPSLLNELVERAGTRGLGTAMLVVIFEGDRDAVTGGLAKARAVLERSGGVWSGDEPARRWLSHRYAVSYRQAPVYAAGAWVDTMEVAAPWDKLGALYDGVRHALGRHAFVMAHLSHAYPDGCCIYFSFAGSANVAAHDRGEGWDDASVVSYEQAWADALRAAEAAGGTIAHHHGVGRSKAPRLSSEVGSGVDVVRALKRALDPHGIMNQGNLLPGAREERRPASPVALPPAAGASLDTVSQLVDVDASVSVAVVESMVQAQGFTLGLSDEATGSVGAWIAAGARGARDPWVDPADHLVAGFVARFRGVEGDVVVRPAPRRAVGPDLLALVVGMHGRFAQLSRVWLRVHPVGAAQGATAPFRAPAPSPPSEEEERMLQRIEEALEQSPG